MRPVKFEAADVVYRGPTPEIGDLWVHRRRPGVIESVWQPSEDERRMIAEGGRVLLTIHSEPIPPVSVQAIHRDLMAPVAEHPWKVIDDPERV